MLDTPGGALPCFGPMKPQGSLREALLVRARADKQVDTRPVALKECRLNASGLFQVVVALAFPH